MDSLSNGICSKIHLDLLSTVRSSFLLGVGIEQKATSPNSLQTKTNAPAPRTPNGIANAINEHVFI